MEKQKVRINSERLTETIEHFANFGRTENNGVTRLALSEEDRLAREYFKTCCEALKMEVKIDDMGNMYALLPGLEERPPVVIGSHLDSVKCGGRFDGVLGVITGLEIVRTLVDNNITPKIPIMLVNFTNEEGARFEPSMMSSGVLSGKFDSEKMLNKKDGDGKVFKEELAKIGFNGSEANRLKEAHAFLELHIEQGPVLQHEELKIGVVDCVVGMVCYEIKIVGDSNHAGTTPMHLRKDALFTTNNFIQDIRSELSSLPDDLVFTMGRLDVSPNVHTVIPNEVIFTIEARHKEPEVTAIVEEKIKKVQETVNSEGCTVFIEKLWDRSTVHFDNEMVQLLENVTKEQRLPYKKMASGAGHDAQFIASMIPTAMLFVPSINGKSHSEDEFTPYDDCAAGVNVMLEAVLELVK
ncbi:Zn-dependent hydrolase [Cytobacillus kochii]|uniref:Zn-dependent hydrolase n=1 Tax=Cytobacillus kochii TaxID=859143 RepID=UPI00203C0F3D|nr:Zn-dependent hydrolase [Cytobacillus kochii]MCM3321109.1 Zn-dependent hydrolase [Cytobacillus kochii]MCM3344058.1 Zn-dependent hydrolase [Cytobacillus kochii]MDM5207903.1 Zn-dependent hydrolase [Cytobacillus kochii]